MRGKGIDYFENSRRATLAQRAYGAGNPNKWSGYGAVIWGWTASDEPGYSKGKSSVNTTPPDFNGYMARRGSAFRVVVDGPLAPTAARTARTTAREIGGEYG